MKKFHKKYTNIDEIFADMQKSGFEKEDWANYYKSLDYNFGDSGAYSNNLKIWYPVLYPWIWKKGGAMEILL